MEITAEGHAGYGARGSDIVCAGVSALLFGYMAYLRGLAKKDGIGQVSFEKREGYLRIRSTGLGALDAHALAVTREGLRLIAEVYPAHVTLVRSNDREGT